MCFITIYILIITKKRKLVKQNNEIMRKKYFSTTSTAVQYATIKFQPKASFSFTSV